MALHQFNEDADRLLCPIKKKVMSHPTQARCCGKIFDYPCIRSYIETYHRCYLCNSLIGEREIDDESAAAREKKDTITGFRFRIRKTYKGLTSDERREQWEQAIDLKMGTGYVNRYL